MLGKFSLTYIAAAVLSAVAWDIVRNTYLRGASSKIRGVPQVAKTVNCFSSSAIGARAWQLPDEIYPTTALTFRFSTRFLYSATCLVAPPPSSNSIKAAVAPPKPFVLYGAGNLPLLIASVTILAPFIAGMPNGPAAPPVKKLGTAIVI